MNKVDDDDDFQTPDGASGTLPRMRFRTTVELGGKTATGLQVPDEVVAALASGKRP